MLQYRNNLWELLNELIRLNNLERSNLIQLV